MMKKYEFTGEKKVVNGVTLRRIIAVSDFYALKPYDPDAIDEFEYRLIKRRTPGGWLESGENLSQDGLAWVADEACVYGKARVAEGALVYGEAQVYEEASIVNSARVFGKAKVHGVALVNCHAIIYDNADVSCGYISDDAMVYGSAHLSGEGSICVFKRAKIYDNARLTGEGEIEIDNDAEVCGNAQIDSCLNGGISIQDNACIKDEAKVIDDECLSISIDGHAQILGSAEIHAGSRIGGSAIIYDSARIYGATVRGSAHVHGDATPGSGVYLGEYADVQSDEDYICIGPIKRNQYHGYLIVFYRSRKHGAKMSICETYGDRYIDSVCDNAYPISNAAYLESFLRDDFADDDTLLAALVNAALNLAEFAREEFARNEEKEA